MSNYAVRCVGNTVSRTLLAEICDKGRLMATLTLSDLHLIGEAKKELCMRTELVLEGAGLQRWIEEHNLPGPARMTKMLEDPGSTKTLDWFWIDLGSLPYLPSKQKHVKVSLQLRKHKGAR